MKVGKACAGGICDMKKHIKAVDAVCRFYRRCREWDDVLKRAGKEPAVLKNLSGLLYPGLSFCEAAAIVAKLERGIEALKGAMERGEIPPDSLKAPRLH